MRRGRNFSGFPVPVSQMDTIDEELEAAKQAQAVISTLSASSVPDPNIVAALRNASEVARHSILPFPREDLLDEARNRVVYAVSDLIREPLTQRKIDNAERAIDAWMVELILP
jgi:hypothetical protein